MKKLHTSPYKVNILNNKIIVDDEKENFDFEKIEEFETPIEQTPADVEREKLKEILAESPISNTAPPVAPAPPYGHTPTDFESHLLKMQSSIEMFARCSQLRDDESYKKAISVFLTEQIEDGKVWKDIFDCGKHFRSWIPYYTQRNLQNLKTTTTYKNGNTNNVSNSRGLVKRPQPVDGKKFGAAW